MKTDKVNAEHAEYNKAASLAAADAARLRYKYGGKHYEDFRAWKDGVLQAWRMRAIAKSLRGPKVVCTDCGHERPIDQFSKDVLTDSDPQCKDCSYGFWEMMGDDPCGKDWR